MVSAQGDITASHLRGALRNVGSKHLPEWLQRGKFFDILEIRFVNSHKTAPQSTGISGIGFTGLFFSIKRWGSGWPFVYVHTNSSWARLVAVTIRDPGARPIQYGYRLVKVGFRGLIRSNLQSSLLPEDY